MYFNKKMIFCTIGILSIIFLFALLLTAQESEEKITMRTLQIDWYMSSGVGVKLQYRDFQNEPHILYLPKQFEKKLFRFVEAPKEYGVSKGLPILLLHMKGQEVKFVDIYTEYMRKKQSIAEFTQEDLDNFKMAEQKGKIEITF